MFYQLFSTFERGGWEKERQPRNKRDLTTKLARFDKTQPLRRILTERSRLSSRRRPSTSCPSCPSYRPSFHPSFHPSCRPFCPSCRLSCPSCRLSSSCRLLLPAPDPETDDPVKHSSQKRQRAVILGSSCSAAVEGAPHDREVMGLNPAICWAFFLFSILSVVRPLFWSLAEVQHY